MDGARAFELFNALQQRYSMNLLGDMRIYWH